MRNTLCRLTLLVSLSFFGCKGNLQTHDREGEQTTAPIHNTLSEAEILAGWELLFDGRTTQGWRGVALTEFPETGWEVVNGELRTVLPADDAERGGDIVTIEQFADFELNFDWKMMTIGGNSGVKYAVAEAGPDVPVVGLEYQLLDDENFEWMSDGRMKPNDNRTLAGIYELYAADSTKQVHPVGNWNTSGIRMENNRIQHWLNGTKVLEVIRGTDDWRQKVAESKFYVVPRFGESPMGHILLQDHGSTMAFRNIKIRKLN